VQLHHALLALPERQAEAVRCRYLEGLSLAETAERLECSEPAVKALVCRGLADLAGRVLPRDPTG
jgi:RNA polymerase sigma-70 factor (ECF subfamily)